MAEVCTFPPKKGDPCWTGGQGKQKGKAMSSRVKKRKPTTSSDDDGDEGAPAQMHMNMRDLDNNPGDTKPQAQTFKTGYTTTQYQQAAAAEKKFAKAKKKLKPVSKGEF